MTDRVVVAAMLALGVLGPGSLRAGEGLAMDDPIELPHAGIALAVPKGFQLQPLGEADDVLRAALLVQGQPEQAVSLSAFAVGEKETADDFAEKMTAEANKSPAIRHLKVRKKAPMTVAGITASARLLTYTYRGVETTAARVFFLREVKNTRVRICYVLTVEATAARKDKLLPVLGEVTKTVSLIDVRHPVAMGVGALCPPLEDHKRGYAICPPRQWYATQTSVGLQMAVTDYLMGGAPSLTATVIVGTAPPGATADSCAREAIQRATKAAEGQNRTAQVVAQSPAKLGGVEGFQFLLSEVPKNARSADLPVFIVHRIVCKPSGKGKEQSSYSLILVCQGGDAKSAASIMEKLAGSFGFIAAPVQTQPATRPKAPAGKAKE